MKIPVILLNYNSSDDCCKCVDFLSRQEGVELEIVIVDNASAPDDAAKVRELCHEFGLTFIAASSNRGYNAGNNIGLRYAASKGYCYAMIANPDMEFPDPAYIATLAAELDSRPEVAVIGSDIVTPEGVHQNPKFRGREDWRNSFSWMRNLIHRRGQINDVPEWVDRPTESKECRCLNGCCLMLRMSFLIETGFFDERTFLYGEEPILGRQAELSGKRMYYFADISAIHDHKKSKEGSSKFCRRHWRHSQLIYIRHYSKQPLYGRILAELSCRLYFALLSINQGLKSKR